MGNIGWYNIVYYYFDEYFLLLSTQQSQVSTLLTFTWEGFMDRVGWEVGGKEFTSMLKVHKYDLSRMIITDREDTSNTKGRTIFFYSLTSI